MTTQPEPKRPHLKKNRICGEDKDCEMGLHDDSMRLFVFDHSGQLVVTMDSINSLNPTEDQLKSYTSNQDICDIIDFIDSPNTTAEGLMLLTGSGTVVEDTVSIICDGAIPSMLDDQRHIISFESDILSDGELMEYIGSMTCPADMVTSDGTMNLGNHVQWMDAETIIS